MPDLPLPEVEYIPPKKSRYFAELEEKIWSPAKETSFSPDVKATDKIEYDPWNGAK
jgi:hypothetical protein